MTAEDTSRDISRQARLARLGFDGPSRAITLLQDPALDGLQLSDDAFVVSADPDQAALGLVRLAEAAGTDALAPVIGQVPARDRLLALLGGSRALTDHLVRHPEHLEALGSTADGPRPLPQALVEPVLATTTLDDGIDALRIAYRRELVWSASRDLASPDASDAVADVAARLADLASTALQAALELAKAHTPGADRVRIAVMGMGKCGGRELNYVSDVDVIHVVEPVAGVQEQEALATGAALASTMARVCSANTAEGTLWPVDANLRPEGKDGPLVRTVASHRAYYERWAKTWEFQALLKARHVAGDAALAQEYLDAVSPMIWEASGRENFVADTQAMRRRVEDNVPAKEADRQIKLGQGGLRDIEFSVQLLQLVHGRTDESLRRRGTLDGLAALRDGGYIARTDAEAMDASYRFLRALEHRNQLDRLKRTHTLPTGQDELRRLGRSMGLSDAAALDRAWRETRTQVRRVHESLYYRPLLAAAARLTTDETRLTPEAARTRLKGLGYRDPAGAMKHIEALTAGVSRRAAIQRQILPVLLGWFAEGIDPDMGLLAFRTLSDSLGTTHWYLKMLRDTSAAQSLTTVLSSSRYVIDLLQYSTEATAWFGDDAQLMPRSADALRAEVDAMVRRRGGTAEAATLARHYRGRELLRTAISDVLGHADHVAVGGGITAATIAALQGCLLTAQTMVAAERSAGTGPDALPMDLAVIAMGSFGGASMGYTSDADVMFVCRPRDGASESEAVEVATAVVTRLQRLLKEPQQGAPVVDLSTELRPEGRQGPQVRSLDSYAEYYRRWAQVWETQALLRAVPVAGDEDLGRAFIELIDPIRYPRRGLGTADVREIRRIKARVEAERLPRGVSPQRHLKLGPGGLTDVEWSVQLLQLQHAGGTEDLRVPSTLDALHRLGSHSLIQAADVEALEAAYQHSVRVRNLLTLWRGRGGEVLPTDRQDLEAAARLMGLGPQSSTQLEDEHLRVTRHARSVFERVFYGE